MSAERTSKELDESEDNYEDEFDEHEGSPEAEQKIRELAEKYNADEQDNENDDDDNYEEDGFEVAVDPNKNHASATGSGHTALVVQQSAPGHLTDHRSSGQLGGRTTPQTDKMSFVKPIHRK